MNNKYNSIKELSNILYFGSNLKLMELKGKVFLTPYIGIASLFIASYYVKSILRYKHNSFSLKYKEWDLSNEQLINPLPNTTIYHNIESLSKFYGTATGFIYFIDITKVKDRLSLYVSNDPDREVIYNDLKPLTILNRIKCQMTYKCEYNNKFTN